MEINGSSLRIQGAASFFFSGIYLCKDKSNRKHPKWYNTVTASLENTRKCYCIIKNGITNVSSVPQLACNHIATTHPFYKIFIFFSSGSNKESVISQRQSFTKTHKLNMIRPKTQNDSLLVTVEQASLLFKFELKQIILFENSCLTDITTTHRFGSGRMS